MTIIKYPKPEEWEQILARPQMDVEQLRDTVRTVLNDVKLRGDEAVKEYELKYDKVELETLAVTQTEMDEAELLVSEELKQALQQAHDNIHRFHASQRFQAQPVQVTGGVTCWQKAIAIERVGLYIPGGTAPLFSTVLMLATPAKIAGCKEIVLTTPPQRNGKVHPAVLVAARIAGVSKVFKAGGVQAIGALAFGTQSVPRVDKIFGPGNQYVMAAKQQVAQLGVAIDMPAGPSEVEVIADATSNPAYVAADLLSQAEHGADSQVVMVTTSEEMIEKVSMQVDAQLDVLPRKEIAQKALASSKLILLQNDEEVMQMTNYYAPEHLIIETQNYMELAAQVVNAGSVFLGSLTPESAGDYASGTNHTLPTSGYARSYNGVNLDSFVRKVTFQELTPQGVAAIGNTVMLMAQNESLDAHCNAMRLRVMDVNK